MKSYTVTITSSGQITLPAEIRRQLGVKPGERVNVVIDDGTVLVKPAYTWQSAVGSVTPISRPEDFEAMIRDAKEERAERLMQKMQE